MSQTAPTSRSLGTISPVRVGEKLRISAAASGAALAADGPELRGCQRNETLEQSPGGLARTLIIAGRLGAQQPGREQGPSKEAIVIHFEHEGRNVPRVCSMCTLTDIHDLLAVDRESFGNIFVVVCATATVPGLLEQCK